MWELGYITLRSAKWRGYLVGQCHSVYEHSFLYPKQSAHLKDHGGVRLPARQCVSSQGVLPIGKSYDFSRPCI